MYFEFDSVYADDAFSKKGNVAQMVVFLTWTLPNITLSKEFELF